MITRIYDMTDFLPSFFVSHRFTIYDAQKDTGNSANNPSDEYYILEQYKCCAHLEYIHEALVKLPSLL